MKFERLGVRNAAKAAAGERVASTFSERVTLGDEALYARREQRDELIREMMHLKNAVSGDAGEVIKDLSGQVGRLQKELSQLKREAFGRTNNPDTQKIPDSELAQRLAAAEEELRDNREFIPLLRERMHEGDSVPELISYIDNYLSESSVVDPNPPTPPSPPPQAPEPVAPVEQVSPAVSWENRPQQQLEIGPGEKHIVRFVEAALVPQDGSAVALPDAYSEYAAWCDRKNEEPVSLPRFSKTCKALGLRLERLGGRVRIFDRRLKEVTR